MKLAIRVQNLDKAVCFLHSTITLRKGMYLAMGK